MPTIQFKGKNIIWNYHHAVPYHVLNESNDLSCAGFKSKDKSNLIVEGDNLIALKSLLPQYSGRIDCIYIDPPYNTGKDNGNGKGWAYNDNVNSPLMQDWLDKEVAADDLTRHDKWLCMMTPRLKLLRDLMSENGVIFISIAHQEFHHLRCLCDEIFNEENYIGRFIWKRKKQPSFLQKHIANVTEYILVFSKNKSKVGKLSIEKVTDDTRRIDNASNEIASRIFKKGIRVKKDTELIKKGIYKIRTMSLEFLDDVRIKDGRTINEFTVKGNFRNKQSDINEFCDDDLLFITENGGFRRLPTKAEQEKQKTVVDLLTDWGDNQDSDKEIIELFGTKKFDFPKPIKLIKNLIASTQNDHCIVLDSFAGSGTTGQAVLDLNKEDGGERKFILIQMTESSIDEPDKNICKDITRERVKKAIEKFSYKSGFTYQRIGVPIDAESLLSGNLPAYNQFAKYVYYLCTGEHLANEGSIKKEKFFVGKHSSALIYLVYEDDFDKLTRLALNLTLAEQIIKEHPNKKVIVYAPACFLDEEYLEDNQIEFVSIPYNLFLRNS